jgi:hypothetical protein
VALEFELRALVLARQALYYLSYASSLYALVTFQVRFCVFAQGQPQIRILLFTASWIAGNTGAQHHIQLVD